MHERRTHKKRLPLWFNSFSITRISCAVHDFVSFNISHYCTAKCCFTLSISNLTWKEERKRERTVQFIDLFFLAHFRLYLNNPVNWNLFGKPRRNFFSFNITQQLITSYLHLINKLNFGNFHEHVMMKMKVFSVNLLLLLLHVCYSLSFESGFLAEQSWDEAHCNIVL